MCCSFCLIVCFFICHRKTMLKGKENRDENEKWRREVEENSSKRNRMGYKTKKKIYGMTMKVLGKIKYFSIKTTSCKTWAKNTIYVCVCVYERIHHINYNLLSKAWGKLVPIVWSSIEILKQLCSYVTHEKYMTGEYSKCLEIVKVLIHWLV